MQGSGRDGTEVGDRVAMLMMPPDAPKSFPGLATLQHLLVDRLGALGVPFIQQGQIVGTPRVTVIGVDAGDVAVAVAAATSGVDSLVLINATLADESVDLIAELDQVSVLTVVDPLQRDRLANAVEGYLASTHDASSIVVDGVDADMAATVVAHFVAAVDRAAIVVEEVTVMTADGWQLGADLHRPVATSIPRPAVVLMHSGRSDRTVFDRLANLIARAGLVALAIDWRGRGTSTNLGRFVDFTAEQQADVRLDVTAAYDFLAERTDVDSSRLGVLGVAHGAGFAANGAIGDPRTRALVMMTAIHRPDDQQREVLASGQVSGLFIASSRSSKSALSLRELYELTTGPRTRLLQYPEGVLGYQMFDLHPELEPAIVSWFKEVLAP